MGRLAFDVDTTLTPPKVIEALTDFTERRPDLWPDLARKFYEIYTVGEAEAHVREGSVKPDVWAKEHYDWSQPNVVRWTVEESNRFKPGYGVVAEVEAAEGGSRVHVTWERYGSDLVGKFLVALLVATRGGPLKSSVKKSFANIEKMLG